MRTFAQKIVSLWRGKKVFARYSPYLSHNLELDAEFVDDLVKTIVKKTSDNVNLNNVFGSIFTSYYNDSGKYVSLIIDWNGSATLINSRGTTEHKVVVYHPELMDLYTKLYNRWYNEIRCKAELREKRHNEEITKERFR